MERRTYLATGSAVAFAAIAGCAGDGDDLDGNDTDGTGANDLDEGGSDEDGEAATGDGNDDENEGETEGSDLLGTFDDFETLEEWRVEVGTLEADAETVYAGSQSARLLASESEERVKIVRELADPIDAEAVVPGLAVSTDGVADPMIKLYDVDGNYQQFQGRARAVQPFVRHNFGLNYVTGEPDLSEIVEIQISHWSGEGNETEFRVDDLHFVPRVERGKVSFQFRGGFETDYTLAYPVLEEYDLTASTFVATSRIREREGGDGARLTEGQLAELADAGWSLGTVGARGHHGRDVDSNSDADADAVESEILEPLEWFETHGYDDARYFALPDGSSDERAYDLVAEHYDLGYTGQYRAQGWASNPLTLTSVSSEEGGRNLEAERMIDVLEWTAEYGGITTIVFHEMDQRDAQALETTAAHLANLVDAGELELIAPHEIADEYVY